MTLQTNSLKGELLFSNDSIYLELNTSILDATLFSRRWSTNCFLYQLQKYTTNWARDLMQMVWLLLLDCPFYQTLVVIMKGMLDWADQWLELTETHKAIQRLQPPCQQWCLVMKSCFLTDSEANFRSSSPACIQPFTKDFQTLFAPGGYFVVQSPRNSAWSHPLLHTCRCVVSWLYIW